MSVTAPADLGSAGSGTASECPKPLVLAEGARACGVDETTLGRRGGLGTREKG